MSKLCGMATYQLVSTGLCIVFFITTDIFVCRGILIVILNILNVSWTIFNI